MKSKTKIVAAVTTFMIAFLAVFIAVQSFASDSMFLNIVGAREGNETYTLTNLDPQKTIWKIVSYDSMNAGDTAKYDYPIYCVNPEIGFGSATTAGNDRKEYNFSFNMKDKTGLEDKYRDIISDQAKYNSILWILDNMYLPKQTPQASKELTKQMLYDAAGITRNVLTDNDIETVQQMALWYFSSDNAHYHYEPENFPSIALNGTQMDHLLADNGIDYDARRYNDMKKLYTYFITSAKANQAVYGTGDKKALKVPNISFTTPADDTITNIETINDVECFVAGPYNFNETNHTKLPYTINAQVLDQNGNAVTGYSLLNSTKNVLESTNIDKTLLGEDFYIAIPTTNTTISKIKLKLKLSYTSTKATLWTHSDNYATEQPVVIPEKEPQEVEIVKEVIVKRPLFDLSLRKFITQVNARALDVSREPIPTAESLQKLADGTATTATYVHPKNPLLVKTGDLVTYTIRVFNEGEIDGYASEVTDYIPEGLKFVTTNKTNQDYMWELSEDETKITTHYLKYNELDDENLIKKFNKDTKTLDYKDIKVVFEVVEPNTSNRVLRNVAEITDDSDARGNEVTDRDSVPNNVDLDKYETEEIPEDNSSWQQDDDDYEPLVLQWFDLSLRKFITKVNAEPVDVSRNPVPTAESLQKLADGTATTATYVHPKNPLLVKTGDLVTYTIRVFNEGEIDGYAEEITDYIPEGLKFVEENETNKKYKWELSEDGKKITTSYLKFIEGESENLIKKFDKDAKALSYKDVEVVCEVTEPNTSNRTLRNIAEISKDLDENGKEVEDIDSTPNNVDLDKYENDTIPQDNSSWQEDDDDFEPLILKPEEKPFDLSLRKFITKVNNTNITTRVPKPTNESLNKLAAGTVTTASYEHPKDPILVKTGDIVTYTIRIYNEGEVAGFAEEITDNIPEGLKFVVDNETNKEYMWKLSEDGKKITTNYLSKAVSEDNLIAKFNKDAKTLDYRDVKVAFEVIEPNSSDRTLINIAEISEDSDESGNPVEDRDSVPDNNKDKEDDIDKEYLVLGNFDLSLRKFITKINSTEITNRIPRVDVSGLSDGTKHTATYTHPKDPIVVKNGDTVVYTIRVYNEGKQDGTATQITDYIPEGLRFVENSTINETYKWEVSEDGKTITTDYLANKEIKAFNKETKVLDYKDVLVEFYVTEPNTSERILRNIAEITNDSGDDEDSTPKNVDLDKYENEEIPEDNSSWQEDDDDYEQIKLQYFDLALRKFITKINSEDVTTRYPVVTMGEDENLKYTHPKDPILVANSDTVIYTIRVFNEGNTAGYAKEVTDDIPEGLAYLPKHEINTKYEWKLAEDGKTVSTDYLSKEKSDEREEDNLLKAFDKTAEIADGNPDYRDLQIAFKVTETNLASNRIIINTAEITDDSDENGNDIVDEDSTPNNNKPGEDDIDKEYLKVKYFDLSLLKWVSKAIVTENGQTTETNTGHTGLENPEPTVKVDLDRKNLNDVTVKFEYTIKVTNEGEIEGYAKEVSDYIPEGLKFVKEDNPGWEEKDGKIVTRKLENTLLKPGQSATVTVILTWINDGENVGLKVNIAEISEDYNEHGSKDIDSTPNNKKDGEDDIDDAPVILTIRTGIEPSYIILTVISITIFAIGIALIKKYVLK